MSKLGRGCRICEENRIELQPEFTSESGAKIWRCSMCGAYWSGGFLPSDEWVCLGRDVDVARKHVGLYQNMVQPRVSIPSAFILAAFIALVTSLLIIFSPKQEDRVAEDMPLSLRDVSVVTGRTTVIDFRSGYLTNHTVILFLDDGKVVQYGEPKNLCYTSNTVSVANP